MSDRIKQKSSSENNRQKGKDSLFIGDKTAMFGGVLAAGIALAGQWLIGQVYNSYEARKLIEAMASSAHYLGSAVVTASATFWLRR